MKRMPISMLAAAPLTMATALAILAPLPAQAQVSLGRLFATPSERAALDANRGKAQALAPDAQSQSQQGGAVPGTDTGVAGVPGQADIGLPPATTPASPPPPEALVMNGVLRTSNGRSTVWLNDVPQSGAANTNSKLSRRDKNAPAVTVTLPSGKKVVLKAGQRYDLNEGRVKDVNEP
jgi:hypothetical protein